MRRGGIASVSVVLALLVCAGLAQEYHHCNNGIAQQYCVTSNPGDTCTDVHAVLTVDGQTVVDEVLPLASAIGGGKITAGCSSSLGICSSCLEISNVDYDSAENELSYEFKAVTTCAGVRTTTHLGTTTVEDCFLGCQDDCNGSGDCIDNECQCHDNFYGESCALEIANNCFQYTLGETQTPLLCSVVDVDVCDFVFSIVDEDGMSFGDVTVNVNELANAAETAQTQVCYPLGDQCEACTQVVNFEKHGLDVRYEMELALDCGSGSVTYPLTTEQVDISPSCADGCDYSTSDPESVSGYSSTLTIPAPVWYYTYLVVDRPRDQPLADLKLYTSVDSGSITVYEKLSCKPYRDDYDEIFGPHGAGDFTDVVLDECDDAHTNHPNGESLLYYFGFLCSNPPCTFTYQIIAHVIRLLEPAVPTPTLYVPLGTEYYYFDFIPRDASPLDFNVLIDRRLGTEVHASLYLKIGDCADKDGDYDYFTTIENEDLSTDETIVYTLTFHPAASVGELVGVTVYLQADCEAVVCTLMTAEVVYSGSGLVSPTPTVSPSVSPSRSHSRTHSRSKTPTISGTSTPVASASPTPTVSPSSSSTPTPTSTDTPTSTGSALATVSPTATPTQTITPTPTITPLSTPTPQDTGTTPVDSSGGESTNVETTGESSGESSNVETTAVESSGDDNNTEDSDLWLYVLIAVVAICGVAILLALVVLVAVFLSQRKKKNFLYVKGVDSDGLRLDDGDFEL